MDTLLKYNKSMSDALQAVWSVHNDGYRKLLNDEYEFSRDEFKKFLEDLNLALKKESEAGYKYLEDMDVFSKKHLEIFGGGE